MDAKATLHASGCVLGTNYRYTPYRPRLSIPVEMGRPIYLESYVNEVTVVNKALARVTELGSELDNLLQQEHDMKEGVKALAMKKARVLDHAHQAMIVIHGKDDARAQLDEWAAERGINNVAPFLNVAHVARELEKVPAAAELGFDTLRHIAQARLSPKEYTALRRELTITREKMTAGRILRWIEGQRYTPRPAQPVPPYNGPAPTLPPYPEPSSSAPAPSRKTSVETGDINARLAAGMRGMSLLGLAFANPEDVKEIICKHYLRMFHPDRGGNQADFVRINAAVKEVRGG